MIPNTEFEVLQKRLEKVNTKLEGKELTVTIATALSLNNNVNATLNHIMNSNHSTSEEFVHLSNTIDSLEQMVKRF